MIHPKVGPNVAQDLGERSNAKRVMRGNRDAVFGAFENGREAHVAARLTCNLIAEFRECAGKFVTRYVTREFQAEMTSSLTKWRRITAGFWPSSKWQETASRMLPFNSSSELACVKMEWSSPWAS